MFRGSLLPAPSWAARTSEMSVKIYQTTRRNSPEDSHLQALEHVPTADVLELLQTGIKKASVASI
jgi:hypothetical protein